MNLNRDAALIGIQLELERIRSEVEAGLAQFQGTSRIDGARYLPAGGRELAWAGAARLVGWSVRAVGNPVVVALRNGRDDQADVVAVIDLPAGGTQTVWFGPGGVSCPEGLFIDRSGTGILEGAVWIGAVD